MLRTISLQPEHKGSNYPKRPTLPHLPPPTKNKRWKKNKRNGKEIKRWLFVNTLFPKSSLYCCSYCSRKKKKKGKICLQRSALWKHYLCIAWWQLCFGGFLSDQVEVAAAESRWTSSNPSWTFRSEQADKGQPLILRKWVYSGNKGLIITIWHSYSFFFIIYFFSKHTKAQCIDYLLQE